MGHGLLALSHVPALDVGVPCACGRLLCVFRGGWCLGACIGEGRTTEALAGVSRRIISGDWARRWAARLAQGRRLPCGNDALERAVTSEATRLRKARYRRSAKGKAAASRYRHSAKGKAAQARYGLSEKGKATTARYGRSEKGKAANAKACARYRRSEKGRAVRKRYRARHKERSADASRP